jgi:hypothetical protein
VTTKRRKPEPIGAKLSREEAVSFIYAMAAAWELVDPGGLPPGVLGHPGPRVAQDGQARQEETARHEAAPRASRMRRPLPRPTRLVIPIKRGPFRGCDLVLPRARLLSEEQAERESVTTWPATLEPKRAQKQEPKAEEHGGRTPHA